MRHGNLFVISGPSGVGKGTLVRLLEQNLDDVWVSVSVTTRPPREGEKEGVEYFFKTEDDFLDLVEAGKFLEWARYSGNYYGTLLDVVQEHIDQGDQVILEIDMQGAFQIKKKFPDAKLVFVEAPSFDELERRLRERGTENTEEIDKRLDTARVELSCKKEYDKQLVNDDLQTALNELTDFVNDQAEK